MIKRKGDKINKPANEAEDLVSYWLHRQAYQIQAGRPLTRIHASNVTDEDWCPRRHALMQLEGRSPQRETIGTATRLVFHQGHSLAEFVIKLAQLEGIAWGDWKCRECGRESAFGRRPQRCAGCGSFNLHYQEVRVRSEVSGISCGLDLLVNLPGRTKLLVVEIKTIDKDKFKQLKMALAEHHERTNLYLRCVAESDHPHKDVIDQTEARVLYVSKGGYGKKKDLSEWGLRDQGWSPFLEFKVKVDNESTQSYVDLSAPLYLWQRGKAGLPDGICPNSTCARAQRCDTFNACFGGKFPAGSHPLKEPLV